MVDEGEEKHGGHKIFAGSRNAFQSSLPLSPLILFTRLRKMPCVKATGDYSTTLDSRCTCRRSKKEK